MPVYTLAANGSTDALNTNGEALTFDISGTFTATVTLEYRATPSGTFRAVSFNPTTGAAASYTAPCGVLTLPAAPQERAAQVRATVSGYSAGTVVIRIGGA